MQKTPSQTLGSYSQHQFPTPMESFNWLSDSIPEWLEKLETLSQQVQLRQDEFEKLSISSMSFYTRFSKKKTGSTESLRPDEKDESVPVTTEPQASMLTNTAGATPTSPAPKLDVNPNNRRLFQEYRDAARRKRKSGSIHSGASGPARYRARTSMVVYYDSEIQNGFESMVRCLASARNTLRKGKNATSYKARMASLAEEESPFDGNRSRLSMRNPRIARFGKGSSPYSMDFLSLEQFDSIDKELEVAQTLCEIGAHQFLRDATSSDELAGVQDKLALCLRLAREGYDLMKAEQETQKILHPPRLERGISDERPKGEPSLPKDKSHESKDYTDSAMGIEIDDGIEIDHNVEIDIEDGISIDLPGPEIEIDIPTSVELDSRKGVFEVDTTSAIGVVDKQAITHDGHITGTDMIEIDGASDDESFHIDLSTIRRTR